MARSNSKRGKAYKPRPVRTDTMDMVKRRKAVLTPAEVASIIEPTRASLDALRTGQAVHQDWYNLSEAAGIALDLSRIGIFSDDGSIKLFLEMYQACGEIGKRFNAMGRLVAKGPELIALMEGLDHHELQLGYASADELIRACNARKAQVMNARASKAELITLQYQGDEQAVHADGVAA